MDKLAEFITNYCLRKNIIDEDKKEIYSYGFMLIFSDIINFTIIISLGILLNHFWDSLLFLAAFCALRQFTGGYHANSFFVCRISFVITYLCVLYLTFILSNINFTVLAFTNILNILYISYQAPIEHPNKPLSIIQKKRNKIKSIITSVLLAIASLVLSNVNKRSGIIITVTLCAVTFLMFIALLTRKGGKKYV